MLYSKTEIETAIRDTLLDPKIGRVPSSNPKKMSKPFMYPFSNEGEISFSLAVSFDLTMLENPHTVYFAMTKPGSYAVWCGDSWCENAPIGKRSTSKMTPSDRATRAAEDAKAQWGVAVSPQNILDESFNVLPIVSKPCNFWGAWKSRKVLCKHCLFVMEDRGLEKAIDALLARHDELTGVLSPTSPVVPTDEHPAMGVLDRYAHQTPVFLDGPPGVGKTYVAAQWAKKSNRKLFVCGGDGGVEASDLKGYLIPVPSGGSVYKPGTVTRAFLEAEKGNPSVLLIDEVYQMPETTFAAFFKVLTPFDNCYTLETDIIEGYDEEGIPICRVIRAPVDKLAIVLTANIGSNYGVQNRSTILAQRCRVEYVQISEPVMASILLKKVQEKGTFNKEEKIAKTLARFVSTTIRLKKDGLLDEPCALRIAARVISHSDSDAEIESNLKAEAMQCVDRDNDGAPVQEQVQTYLKAVETAFAKF